jgi:hypothetical protein
MAFGRPGTRWEAHNPEVTGSNPVPATRSTSANERGRVLRPLRIPPGFPRQLPERLTDDLGRLGRRLVAVVRVLVGRERRSRVAECSTQDVEPDAARERDLGVGMTSGVEREVLDASQKGTETLITPATCPFTKSVLVRTTHAAGARSCPRPLQRPVLESQALKSWMASLAADPMQTSQIVSQGCLSMTGRRSESQVSGMN